MRRRFTGMAKRAIASAQATWLAVPVMLLMVVIVDARAEALVTGTDYARLSPSCASCLKLEELINEFSKAKDGSDMDDVIEKMGKEIDGISLRGKSRVERRRAIYYAIKATVEAMDADHEDELAADLIILRRQGEVDFDYVFNHSFSKKDQDTIVEKMAEVRHDRILRFKFTLPKTQEFSEP